MPTPNSDIYYIEVVGKALHVLNVFAETPNSQLSLPEVCNPLHLNRNSVFRILYTLTEHGYLLKENSKYRLGPKLIRLSDFRPRYADLIGVAYPYLDGLREQFGETVNLGVLEGGQILYIDVRESQHKFRLAERVGGRDPLHSTALGKAHLAYLTTQEVRDLMRRHEMPRFTDYTLTSLSALKADLQSTRERGYAVDRQESLVDAYCVAVAILDSARRPIAAISISGPIARFNEQHLSSVSRALLEACATMQSRLGSAATPFDLEEAPSRLAAARTGWDGS